MKSITVNNWLEVPTYYTGHVKYTKSGRQEWYKNGKRHREDGPALIYPDGTQWWCLDGKFYIKKYYYKELYKRGIITEQELFIELL